MSDQILKRKAIPTHNRRMTPQTALRRFASRTRAEGVARFFKTGKGEYGEGDVFIGVSVPDVRAVAKTFAGLSKSELSKLLKSKVHEERLLALIVLTRQYEGDPESTYRFYMKHRLRVNNWDLVDTSAPEISGPYLFDHPRERAVLAKLVKSENVWERRIAMISMFHFIRQKRYREPLQVAEALLKDDHDLIHKAVGWMLRELGKRGDRRVLDAFLETHAARMPRTALRYAIERHSPAERKRWLARGY
jgi:3-methyladenine DNA glycosylase AlkD